MDDHPDEVRVWVAVTLFYTLPTQAHLGTIAWQNWRKPLRLWHRAPVFLSHLVRDKWPHFESMNRNERLNMELTDGTRALYQLFDNVFTCLHCLERNEVHRFELFRDAEVKDLCSPLCVTDV